MHDSSTQPHPTPSALIVAPAPAGPRASSPPRRPCESRDPAPDARKCDRTAYEKVSSLTRTHVFSDFAAARSDAFACVSVGSATPSHSPSTACVAARASPRAPLVAKSSSGLRLPAETLPGRRPASPSGYGGGSGASESKSKSKSKSKSDEPMVPYRFAGELGRWAPACARATSRSGNGRCGSDGSVKVRVCVLRRVGGMRGCAGAATWMLSQHGTSLRGEPSAPTLDATCGTERVGRIRPAGGRPGRPAVLAEARRPNREPPPGARARRGASHKTWPRSGILSQATVEPERRGWGPAALQAT